MEERKYYVTVDGMRFENATEAMEHEDKIPERG